jgi:alkylation response protein AidB-like acyl-CoA dehydrogenase
MDFELSAEERAFEAEVERFLESHRSPEVMDENPEQLSQTVDTPPKRALMRAMAERGWLGMSWPARYGGAERSGIYDFVLTEALSRYGAPQPGKGVGIVGKTIIRHGNEKLKAFFLPRIIRGEIEFAIGYSEPNAGSDAANMQLRATRDEARRGWVLRGQKIWTTSAHFADWYWVGARTDPQAKKHAGITLFLVEMRHPGLTIRPTWTIGDERTNEVFFDDVFVSDDFVVGQVGHGWTYICGRSTSSASRCCRSARSRRRSRRSAGGPRAPGGTASRCARTRSRAPRSRRSRRASRWRACSSAG